MRKTFCVRVMKVQCMATKKSIVEFMTKRVIEACQFIEMGIMKACTSFPYPTHSRETCRRSHPCCRCQEL